ncbi:MAG: histidine kinase [Acidobacteriaceae bacterium]|nr:histidine kinase [Acidobacteriaceae bacterium]
MDELLQGSPTWIATSILLVLGMAGIYELVRRKRRQAVLRRLDRRVRAELEAYAQLEVRNSDADLGARVCRVVAERSAFRQVAMLSRDEEGRLTVTAQLEVSDAMVAALNGWGEQMLAVAPRLSRELGAKRDETAHGSAARSGVREPVVRPWTRRVWMELAGCEVWLVPMWTTAGRMVGAVAVSAERQVRPEDLVGVEALVAKLGWTLENAALAERLLKSEKLAGLGQLAGGVAHALNNPLTAVMGFAELIAETTDQVRVQEDAATILREATRMRETVQSLLDLWRPATLVDEAVSVSGLVRELAASCEGKLKARGVRMVVEMGEAVAEVRGSRERIRLVMEHLLNNAAQAIAASPDNIAASPDDFKTTAWEHFIRVTVRRDERGVQVIVSDTGPGFVEPARVFDPFYTMQHAGEGAGLGLSICYGIVREHGGEISAFNLHPRGAAVVVEMPEAAESREAVVLSD